MANERLGDDFRLNFDSTNTYNASNWANQTSVGDLGFDFNEEQVEIPKRIGYKLYKGGRQDWELSFKMNYDPTNVFHIAARAAIENKSKIHLAVSDGLMGTNNTHYWHAWWLLGGNLDASLDTAASIDVKGKCHHDTGVGDAEAPAAATS